MSVSPPYTYAFPLRALRRWASEHLRVTRAANGEIEAVFRLVGSTCGNVPLVMLYLVRLGAEEEGWPVRRLFVGPSPHDDGHRHQCAWRSDEEELLKALRDEQPGLGQPLGAVLAWTPTTSPAGCLCTEASRAHKWRIVLHTLHYALTQPDVLPLHESDRALS